MVFGSYIQYRVAGITIPHNSATATDAKLTTDDIGQSESQRTALGGVGAHQRIVVVVAVIGES